MTETPTQPPDGEPDTGFDPAEQAIGGWAAYKHPFMTRVVSGQMLGSETSPTRRQQLSTLRTAATAWWIAGLVAGLLGVIAIAVFASTHGFGGDCRGGPDKFDAMNITYQSTDNQHWTATYPCRNGGSTTIPVPRRAVPGGG